MMQFSRFSEAVMPIDKLEWMILASFPIEIRPFASGVALEVQAIHVFVDKLDLAGAYMDSNGSRDHAIDEYGAYLRSVLIQFRRKYGDRHTMDYDIAQLMR